MSKAEEIVAILESVSDTGRKVSSISFHPDGSVNHINIGPDMMDWATMELAKDNRKYTFSPAAVVEIQRYLASPLAGKRMARHKEP